MCFHSLPSHRHYTCEIAKAFPDSAQVLLLMVANCRTACLSVVLHLMSNQALAAKLTDWVVIESSVKPSHHGYWTDWPKVSGSRIFGQTKPWLPNQLSQWLGQWFLHLPSNQSHGYWTDWPKVSGSWIFCQAKPWLPNQPNQWLGQWFLHLPSNQAMAAEVPACMAEPVVLASYVSLGCRTDWLSDPLIFCQTKSVVHESCVKPSLDCQTGWLCQWFLNLLSNQAIVTELTVTSLRRNDVMNVYQLSIVTSCMMLADLGQSKSSWSCDVTNISIGLRRRRHVRSAW